MTLVFCSDHKFSVGFKSGLCRGQWVTFILIFWRQFYTSSNVCFRLFCWKTKQRTGYAVDCFIASFFVHDSFHIDDIPPSRHTEAPPLHNIPTTVLHCGNGVLWVVRNLLLPPSATLLLYCVAPDSFIFWLDAFSSDISNSCSRFYTVCKLEDNPQF